jgi:hypothetical protein
MLGLAGSWEDTETGLVHTIIWDDARYQVVSAISAERGEYPLIQQNWDGASLYWTYLVLSTKVSVSFQTVSVAGDTLSTIWQSTNGTTGSEILRRVAGPPEPPALAPTPRSGAEPMSGLAGTWRDGVEGNTHTIEWDGRAYHAVSSVNDEHGAYQIAQEYWDGSAFTWTYYVPQTGVAVTIQAALVEGDILYLNWWSTNGRSGSDAFNRAP